MILRSSQPHAYYYKKNVYLMYDYLSESLPKNTIEIKSITVKNAQYNRIFTITYNIVIIM